MDKAKLLLFSEKKEISDIFRNFYQQKFGLFFFTAIVIRAVIAFAIAKLL